MTKTTLTREERKMIEAFMFDNGGSFRLDANNDDRGFALDVDGLSTVAFASEDYGKWIVRENGQYPSAPIGTFTTLAEVLEFVASHDWDEVARRNRNGKYSYAGTC
jgi:hypothetical protein